MDSLPLGRRIVPSAIDQLARICPAKTWVSFIRNHTEVQHVSFRCCAAAVNAASWWLKATLGTSTTFETVAYIGPNDIRYLILFCAAAKCGYKLLLSSPRNSHVGHANLLRATACMNIIYDSRFNLGSLPQIPGIAFIPAPELKDLLDADTPEPFLYERTFDEVKNEPCIVLHTSGTTSLPKPVTLTHGQLAVFDAQWNIPPVDGRETFLQGIASCPPFLIALPFFHMAGFSMSLWIPLNPITRVIFTCGSIPLSLFSIEQALDIGCIGAAIIPPSLLQDAAESASVLAKLSRLRYVFYGGAPLSPKAGYILSSRTHLCNQIGSTESIVFTTHITDRNDWSYFRFGSEWCGYDFRETDLPDTFELVIVKDKTKEAYQAVFQGNELTEFSTGDLYSKHPTKPHHWKYRGRSDDVIILSHGEKLHPLDNESMIGSHPFLSSAMYVGNGRSQPAAILEVSEGELSKLNADQVIDAVWPLIEEVNSLSPSHSQLHKSHLIIANSSKRFLRTAKGTLRRRETAQLFEAEMREVFEASVRTPNYGVHVDVAHSDELQSFVHMVYQKVTGCESLRLDEDIFLAGANSLNIQEAILELKAAIFSPQICIDGSWINQKAVYANPTTLTMTRFLGSLGRPQVPAAPEHLAEQQQFLQKVYEQFRRQFPDGPRIGIRETTAPTTVLLTGSTGNLGSYLLDALLRRSDIDTIICLNRSKNAAERQMISAAEKGLRMDFNSDRTIFMHADLSQPQFGLGQHDYEYILSRTTVIIHNQWPVNFNLPLSSFEPQLQGVVNLVKFAVEGVYSPRVFFVSSIAAVNNWRRQIHLDSPAYDIPERHFTDLLLASGGYGQSKAIAADLLYYASSQCGLRGAIVRLGQVAGASKCEGGVWNTNEWFPSLISTSRTMGVLPEMLPLLNEIDWIPVDSAAQVLVELALDSYTPSSNADLRQRNMALFNVANPNTIPWGKLIPAVQDSVQDGLKTISFPEWLAMLESSMPVQSEKAFVTLPALKLLGFFRGLQEGENEGAKQTMLQTEATVKSSLCLANMGAITKKMTTAWLERWKA
ncbi:acetyl-CoA synthetase-like protein [Xylaria cubensis]|nr:acetyl-CoA synthetase-like protein [Xylaria cubensis]